MLMLRMAEPGTRPPGTCSDFVKTLIKAARLRNTFSVPRKKLTCSGHAANSRRYRDLGSTCLCRGREWLDLNGVAKVGQSPPPGLRRRRGAPVNKKSRKRARGPMTARGDSLGCSRNPGSNLYAGLFAPSQ